MPAICFNTTSFLYSGIISYNGIYVYCTAQLRGRNRMSRLFFSIINTRKSVYTVKNATLSVTAGYSYHSSIPSQTPLHIFINTTLLIYTVHTYILCVYPSTFNPTRFIVTRAGRFGPEFVGLADKTYERHDQVEKIPEQNAQLS